MSHKASKRPYEAVVLAQVLGTSAGVVWVVAASQDGAFLATAGQDCVLRVWQLTASRSKHPRTNWVYSSSSGSCADAALDSHSTAHAGAGDVGSSSSSSSSQQQQGLQLPEQAADHAGGQDAQQAGSSVQQETTASSPQDTLQQQPQQRLGARSVEQPHSQEQEQQRVSSPLSPPAQQQQQQSQPEQPPVIEFGDYFSRTPVRQYQGHVEDILDVSWSPSGGFLLSASLDKTVRLWHLSQPECLRSFEHSDFVTSVQFHPSDAQRFVSGAPRLPRSLACMWIWRCHPHIGPLISFLSSTQHGHHGAD
jgi:hypothetical protein